MKINVKKLAITLCFILLITDLTYNSKSVDANNSEKIHYYFNLAGTQFALGPYGGAKKVKISNNKLTIWASMTKASSHNKVLNGKGKKINYKKRVFTISKNCKFYGTDPESIFEITRSEFIDTVKGMNGLGLELVLKNGKIIKTIFYS